MARKTWREKLEENHPSHGKITAIPLRLRKRLGSGRMIIPRPLDVDARVRGVRRGRLITQSMLRAGLAHDAGVEATCPLCTGIFMRIVAEVAELDEAAGKKRITPYWRVVRDDGGLNDKFPGGVRKQAKRLRAEGLSIRPARGQQPPKVKDFEAYLQQG